MRTTVKPGITKARAELLRYVLDGRAQEPAWGQADGLLAWLDRRPRFEQFLDAHRDKVRKKLRTAGSGDALLDVRAELLVASLLAADRRFELAFEAYGSGNAGPDLTVTFRASQRFNVEVTRLRAPLAGSEARVRAALLAKVRQLPTGAANVLALVSPAPLAAGAIGEGARQLKRLADRKDEDVFTRRGYESARAFLAAFPRLSAVIVAPEHSGVVPELSSAAGAATQWQATVWLNAQAKHHLSREASVALERCLTAAEAGVLESSG